MSVLVKAIVAWFIALAIPLQGMAAVVFPLCPPDHHPAAVAASVDASHHRGGSHHGDPHGSDSHVDGTHGIDLHPGVPALDHHSASTLPSGGDATAGDAGVTGHHHLNCCSATCAMVAMPLAGIGVHAPSRSPGPLAAAEPVDLGITPDGLDRPPKSIVA